MTKQTGGPAFPSQELDNNCNLRLEQGMTLRDYFAAKALQGMNANPEDVHNPYEQTYDEFVKEIARCAYKQADAMLKAREQSIDWMLDD